MSDIKKVDTNTGDTRYQINKMTDRIKSMQIHLTSFKKDFNTKASLYTLVAKRKTFLRYLARTQPKQYEEFIKTANFRISSTTQSKY